MTKWIAVAAALALVTSCARKRSEEQVDTTDQPPRKWPNSGWNGSGSNGSAGSAGSGSATAEAPGSNAAPMTGSAGPGSAGPGGPSTGSAGTGSAAKADLKPGELPAECTDFTAAMHKLATCASIPKVTRDALTVTYDEAQKSWATMTPESKATIAKACKAGADSVNGSTSSCK
jgi:hypothetical protein|nr:hypothetical protein [Kofleriaceae bacterium]